MDDPPANLKRREPRRLQGYKRGGARNAGFGVEEDQCAIDRLRESVQNALLVLYSPPQARQHAGEFRVGLITEAPVAFDESIPQEQELMQLQHEREPYLLQSLLDLCDSRW